MKIAICSSMVFAEKMLEVRDKLENLGHEAFISKFAEEYLGKTVKEIEVLTLYHKNERDAIRDFWEVIKISDAVLVLNYDRRGVSNYIGGNTLMEIGFAHVLNKKIFLMNPVPEIEYYKSEIEAVKPVVLYENLETIR